MRYAIPPMVVRGGGSIISVASIAAHIGLPGHAPYCASKAGVLGLTRAAAVEYGEQKIRVNSISPGFTLTPLAGTVTDEVLAGVRAMTALRRPAQPGEIAAAALYLASDDSSFVTGTDLIVDGGYVAA